MTLYLANPCGSAAVKEAMLAGVIGYIDTPAQGNIRPPGITWCADNGCYGQGYPGDDKWLDWLARNAHDVGTCLFATAPDVVGDAAATLQRSMPLLPKIRELGYKAALVAQDGLEFVAVPWDSFDVLFIGGTTEWKLGVHAYRLVAEAKRRGKHVHMGRVNTRSRLRFAHEIGCDSVDGTYLIFGPDKNLPRLTRWLKQVNRTQMFQGMN